MPSDLLTFDESAEILNTNAAEVEKLVKIGVFYTISFGNQLRIARNLIEAFRDGKIRIPRKKYPRTPPHPRCPKCGALSAQAEHLCPACRKFAHLSKKNLPSRWYIAQCLIDDRNLWLAGEARPLRMIESHPTLDAAREAAYQLNTDSSGRGLFFYFVNPAFLPVE